jgi:hypothetical protein
MVQSCRIVLNGGVANYVGKIIAGHTMAFHSVTSNYEKLNGTFRSSSFTAHQTHMEYFKTELTKDIHS